MGKIKKLRAKSSATSGAEIPKPPSPDSTVTIFSQCTNVPKDFDVASLRSFKSMKHKFGIKKQIKKTEKVKMKKEILKQKIDTIKESQIVNKKKKGKKKGQNEFSKPESNPFYSANDNKKIVRDEEEEYVKLGIKIKGIPKKEQRRKQKQKDINTLKSLMSKKLK